MQRTALAVLVAALLGSTPVAGRCEVDGSGFAAYLLRRAAPTAGRELVGATVKRPLAHDFVSLIAAIAAGRRRGHWARVGRARDLRPGDVVAWLRPADSCSSDTRHVMLVAGPLGAAAAGELLVPVIDSSALPHGEGTGAPPRSATGVGSGTIVLVLDAGGSPVGFRWAPERRFRRHDADIGLGRVEE